MTLGDTWVNCGGSAGNVSQSLARDIGLQGEFKGDDHRAECFQLCALLEMPVGCLTEDQGSQRSGRSQRQPLDLNLPRVSRLLPVSYFRDPLNN